MSAIIPASSRVAPAAARVARIAGVALAIAAGLLMVAAIALTILPRMLNWQGIIVLSGSMEPALRTGGLVFIDREADPHQLEVGDVITFRRDSRTQITHRVIAVSDGPEGRRYQTRGDANGTADAELVPPEAVVGKMVLAVPYAGRWVNWFQQQNHLQLLIWPVVALIVLNEVWNLGSQWRRGREQAGPEAPDTGAQNQDNA